ncbi:MAG TPA: DNA polymerase III subunit gamma/tau [Acholeplasmataceae bacterium]|nr:DNA polymerase III subunit gamma/tau [Acholeplasmataceae bacterium]
MSYVALYRVYRPKTFDEVAGQNPIVQTLKNAVKTNKIGHAYIFSGPRGTGKTSLAKIFANAVNCINPSDGNPCGSCDACESIKINTSDVIEIDGASNNGVDEIRELRDKVKYMPSVGRYKVYIIDEVHMLTTGAFNALLKTLEEPPAHVIFILATTEVHKIPLTILSRCQRFDFKNIDLPSIIKRLKEVILSEDIKIDEDAIESIAYNARGGLRDALSLLDQTLSYANGKIKVEDVNEVSGTVSRKDLVNILEKAALKKTADVIKLLNEFLEKGKEEERIINDLILTLRDTLLEKFSKNKTNDLKPVVDNLTVDKIYFYIEVLTKAQNNMRYTHQKRVYLELALIQMIEHETIYKLDLNSSIINLRKDFEELKKKGIKTTAVKAKKGNALVDIKDIEETLHEAEHDKKERLEKLMNIGFSNANDDLKMVALLLGSANLVAASNNQIILTHDDLSVATQLMQPSNKQLVLELFNTNGNEINKFNVILESDWQDVRRRYVDLLKTGQKRPKIGEYDFKIYEVIKNDKLEEEPESVRLAKEFFGEEIVEIKE